MAAASDSVKKSLTIIALHRLPQRLRLGLKLRRFCVGVGSHLVAFGLTLGHLIMLPIKCGAWEWRAVSGLVRRICERVEQLESRNG